MTDRRIVTTYSEAMALPQLAVVLSTGMFGYPEVFELTDVTFINGRAYRYGLEPGREMCGYISEEHLPLTVLWTPDEETQESTR